MELFRAQGRFTSGRHLAIFDGGYTLANVVRPVVLPQDGSPLSPIPMAASLQLAWCEGKQGFRARESNRSAFQN